MARRAAPFVVLAPLAIWVGVSADGYFAGVAAWGIALLSLAAGRTCRAPDAMAVGAGVLLGWAVYLDYGLILLAIPCVAVLVATRNVRPLLPAALGAVAIAACFTVSGFWWLGGLGHLRARYWAGIARDRPYRYWIWANLVSLTCAIGLPAAIAVRRAADRSALARRAALPVLLVAFLIVIVAADVSGLSKAETERIWLPFAVWLVAAPALLPPWTHRYLLVVQAFGALADQQPPVHHLVAPCATAAWRNRLSGPSPAATAHTSPTRSTSVSIGQLADVPTELAERTDRPGAGVRLRHGHVRQEAGP